MYHSLIIMYMYTYLYALINSEHPVTNLHSQHSILNTDSQIPLTPVTERAVYI